MSDWEEEFPAFRRPGPTKHAVRKALEFIKERPFETILFGGLYAFFVNGVGNLYRFFLLLALVAPEEHDGNDLDCDLLWLFGLHDTFVNTFCRVPICWIGRCR